MNEEQHKLCCQYCTQTFYSSIKGTRYCSADCRRWGSIEEVKSLNMENVCNRLYSSSSSKPWVYSKGGWLNGFTETDFRNQGYAGSLPAGKNVYWTNDYVVKTRFYEEEKAAGKAITYSIVPTPHFICMPGE